MPTIPHIDDLLRNLYLSILQGPIGKSSISSTAARMTTRKISSDHLILNVGAETEQLITAQESEDKGMIFSCLLRKINKKCGVYQYMPL